MKKSIIYFYQLFIAIEIVLFLKVIWSHFRVLTYALIWNRSKSFTQFSWGNNISIVLDYKINCTKLTRYLDSRADYTRQHNFLYIIQWSFNAKPFIPTYWDDTSPFQVCKSFVSKFGFKKINLWRLANERGTLCYSHAIS